ncbi:MAG TPA: cytochrome C oxidase subunit IV family protein [Anaeromyxobacteraceae bacterium]|nr:cytochrome C oxidase subunit IV family protein [Anaeromyxobacteraceae bacterium]
MVQSRNSVGEEHAGLARYWIVWVALLVGTVATFLMSRVHLPSPFHLLTALFIACTKSMLVVLFFMHLWDHGGANRLVFVTSLAFVALFIGLIVLDNGTRFELTNPARGATLKQEPPGPDLIMPEGVPVPWQGHGNPLAPDPQEKPAGQAR